MDPITNAVSTLGRARTHPLLGASRIFPLVAVLFPGVEKRVLLEFCFCVSVAADDKKFDAIAGHGVGRFHR